jgi:hypothetical protein
MNDAEHGLTVQLRTNGHLNGEWRYATPAEILAAVGAVSGTIVAADFTDLTKRLVTIRLDADADIRIVTAAKVGLFNKGE